MNTALIVIDLINDIVHPDGELARAAEAVRESGLIARCNRLSARARAAGATVAMVRVAFAPDYSDLPRHSPLFGRAAELGALRDGDWGTRLHDGLLVGPRDWIVTKPRVSALFDTDLEARLHAAAIRRVTICGVSTETGVQTTARDAHDRDFEVTVVGDLCASADPQRRRAALEMLTTVATIADAEQVDFGA
ncbi:MULTISPECIES: cysteine hydrolase family protein [Lysobacter]|uniref:Isochorismatase family cysteine hydrolase n=1 Tax=Lysobacter firmicutimachus TaxID=1792846 RepID=A0ABU8D9B0_9GAMM|nr:isochorismatase family cysteine hydrolase [Lysobacter antibioticus]